LLTSQRVEPALLIKKQDELSLSGTAFITLLRAVLDKGVPFRFRATGFSMSPFIRDGDVLTVSPLSGRPRLGDVVAFVKQEPGALAIHRVVGTGAGVCLIRGDNSSRDDGYVPEANILGRITKVKRNGKRILLGLGPERYVIGVLACKGLLIPWLSSVPGPLRTLLRRMQT
jgi:signal peptidase I